MNDVSKEVFSHVIVFHDGSRKFLFPAQFTVVMGAIKQGLKLIATERMGVVAISGISKILTVFQFYDEYPAERPEQRAEFKVDLENQLPTSRFWLTSAINGLKQAILAAEQQGTSTNNMHEKLKQMETKLSLMTKK